MKNSWNFSSNPRIRIFVKICKNLFKKAEKTIKTVKEGKGGKGELLEKHLQQ